MPGENHCPVSGLPILTLPEYTHIPIGKDYYTSFKKIGNAIVYIQSKGNLKHFSLEKFNERIEEFCSVSNIQKPYVQIRNLSLTHGRMSFRILKQQIRYFFDHQDTLTGLVLIEQPDWIRPFINQSLRLFKTTFQVSAVKDYSAGIRAAMQIQQTSPPKSDSSPTEIPLRPIRMEDFLFRSDWTYQNAYTGFVYKVGAIPKRILYVSLKGSIKQQEDIHQAGLLVRRVMKEAQLKEIAFIFSDFSELDNFIPARFRRELVMTFRKVNSETNNHKATLIVINPGWFNRVAIKAMKPFVKQQTLVVDSFQEACAIVNQSINIYRDDSRHRDIYVSVADLEEISNIFGIIHWGDTQNIPEVKVSENNPMGYLAESLELIRHDITELRDNEIRIQEERFQESENNRAQLLRMMDDIQNTKKALEKAEEAQSILLDNIPTQIWYLTDPTTYGAVNKAHADFFGYKAEDMAFRRIQDIFPQELASSLFQAHQEVFTLGKAIHKEAWRANYAGVQRLLSIIKTPKLRADGSVEYVVCSAEDITERKQAEESLAKSEVRYRTLFDQSRDAVMTLTPPSWKFTSANPAIVKLFGTANMGAFLALGPWEVSPEYQPDGQQSMHKARQMIEIAMQQGAHFFEWTHRRLDGTEFPATVLLSRIQEADESYLQAVVRDISDQKHTEQQLRESQRRLLSLMGNLPGMAYRCKYDPYWSMEFVSEGCMALTGYTPEELINNQLISFENIIHEDYRLLLKEQWELAITNHRQFTSEYPIHTKSGHIKWVWEQGSGVFAEDGQLIALEGFITDLTERKLTEEQLRESKEKYQLLADHASEMIYRMKIPEGDYDYVSPAALKLFGYTPEVFYQHPMLIKKLIHPDWQEYLDKQWQALLAGEEPDHFRYQIKDREGNIRWIEQSNAYIKDSQGKLVALQGIVRDITPHKEAEQQIIRARELAEENQRRTQQLYLELQISEEELRAANEELQASSDALAQSMEELDMAREKALESEELYRSLLQTVPDIIVKTDIQGTITFINDQILKRIENLAGNNLLGQNIFSFIAEPDLPRAIENTHLMFEKNLGVREYRMSLDGKRYIDSEVNGEVMRDKHGNPTGMVYIIRDITERKLMEQERQQKTILEKKVAVAEDALRFKQNFLANMSHEIRTPLTGVLGMIDILEQTLLDEHQRDYLNTIKTSGENLREIINQVLDYSKIEAGKININPSVFAFKSLSENAVALYKNNLKAGVRLQHFIDPKIPAYIEADRSRLAQVLNNLVSNAVKFTHQGSVNIHSYLLSTPLENNQVCIKIEVTDTGIGIPEELQQKLFVPFSQIEAMDTRHYEGTGLGLSICRQLIDLMGGQSGVFSEPGKGSTFWFTFPAMVASAPTKTEQTNRSTTRSRQLRILLAEDKAVNQKVISLMLSAMGHEVEIASNGQQALDCFEPGKYDLILMDIQMPVMDGLTATQKLKQTHTHLPPIVGLSANAFEGDREKYMSQGMDEYLTKPVKEEDFLKIIHKFI